MHNCKHLREPATPSPLVGKSWVSMKRPTFRKALYVLTAAGLCFAAAIFAQQQASHPGDLGFTDTPMLPNQPWHVHDSGRPHPAQITPGATLGAPSSDAVVLFDGKDLSKWAQNGRGANRGKIVDPAWKVENGYFQAAPGTGDLFTREKFGDCQLHI